MSRELIGNKGKLPAGRRESCKQPLSGDLQGPLVAFSADRATCLLFMQFSNLLRLRGVYGFMQIALGALGQWRCASDACRRRAAESAASAAGPALIDLPVAENRWISTGHLLMHAASHVSPSSQIRVLDVGGITFGNLAKLYGWKYISVDIEASLSTGNGGHMQHADLFYDGRNLPFGKDSFDIVILSFVLHHAAENTLPLLRQVRAIATSFVIIGEDLMTLEHHPDWLRRLYDHQPGGLYRSDEEWRTLFCLHDLRHVSTHRIRNHQDMGDPVSEAVIASKTEEWFQERPLRALYLLRSDTGSGAPRSCPDETPATVLSSNTAAARAATVDANAKVNLNIVDTMGKMSSYHLETTEATANGE